VASAPLLHIGLSLGRVAHWHDGLGEFSRQLGLALAARAAELRADHGWRLHFHLPARWHGCFGDEVGYLATHTSQRWLHLRATRFALWHVLHQHNRLRAPLGTQRQVETVHDLNFLHAKSPAKIERYRNTLRRRLAQRDAAIAITQHVANDLQRELVLPGAPSTPPVTVIHNGATDLSRVAREPVAGVDAGRPYLLHISRMAPNKNISALLDLAAAWPDMALVLAGATSTCTGTVAQLVAQRGLRNVTIALDLSEGQKAWLYAHCAGFVFPSLAEGFGLPVIEAMHFGKPVFLSRLTSLPEVGGAVAHYVDGDARPGSFDGAAMRAVVQAALAAHGPAQAAAVATHAQGFSWQRCAQGHVALYRQLLAGRDATP
jgi:glycosyltransferase involved in cell wall biosynthesis